MLSEEYLIRYVKRKIRMYTDKFKFLSHILDVDLQRRIRNLVHLCMRTARGNEKMF
jgi:hypothetical protein